MALASWVRRQKRIYREVLAIPNYATTPMRRFAKRDVVELTSTIGQFGKCQILSAGNGAIDKKVTAVVISACNSFKRCRINCGFALSISPYIENRATAGELDGSQIAGIRIDCARSRQSRIRKVEFRNRFRAAVCELKEFVSGVDPDVAFVVGTHAPNGANVR